MMLIIAFIVAWCFYSNVVWLADTNYRIDLDNELVRSLAVEDDYDGLLAADQVCLTQPSTIKPTVLAKEMIGPLVPRISHSHSRLTVADLSPSIVEASDGRSYGVRGLPRRPDTFPAYVQI